MRTYKIHLIRHGLTRGNLEGRYIGVTDLPLCPQGRAQLEELLEQGEYPMVERVYVSPLLRARQTAQLLFPGWEPVELAGLREMDFGAFEGRTGEALEGTPDFASWISSPQAAPPGGESAGQLMQRVAGAIAHIFAQMMEEKLYSVAAVTHGGIIAGLLASMGLPQREAVRWSVGPGEGYTLLLTPQMWMRDQKFEVYGRLPLPRELFAEQADWYCL